MSTTKRRGFIQIGRWVAFLTIVLLLIGDCRPTNAQNAAGTITFLLEGNRFIAGEPILLQYIISNKMPDQLMGIASGNQRLSWLTFQLLDEEQKEVFPPVDVTSKVRSRGYVDGVPLYTVGEKLDAAKFHYFIMPHETSDGYIRVSEKFPTLKPGKYQLKIHAALATSAAPVPPGLLELPTANPPLKQQAPHLTGILRNSMVLRFTILPADKATIDARGAELHETVMIGSPPDVRQAIRSLVAWPKESSSALWRSLLQDPRLVQSRKLSFINAVRSEAYKGNSGAINLLGYMTWEAKIGDERLHLKNKTAPLDVSGAVLFVIVRGN